MARMRTCAAAIAIYLAFGCASRAGETNSISVVYGFLVQQDSSLTFGPDRKAGRDVSRFLSTRSAVLSSPNVTHVAVQILPFSRSESCQRPFDLRLVEAKLDVFINWMADGKIQFLPERIEQIPLEKIEDLLRLLCQDIGVEKPTMLRGMGWKDRKTHNQAPEDTARKLADPQR